MTQMIESIAADVAYEHAEDVLQAEELLKEIVEQNRQPNHSELTYFQRHLQWSDRQVTREVIRMRGVLRDKAIAGTPQDREAARQEMETATAVLDKEGDKIATKIAELQSKLTSMERDARLSAKRVEEQTAAVDRLREQCPEHVRREAATRRNALDHSIGRELLDIGVRVNELECVLDRTRYPNTKRGEQLYLDCVQRCRWDAVDVGSRGGWQFKKLSANWPAIRTELKRELGELKSKSVELQETYDSELAKIQSQLDFYTS